MSWWALVVVQVRLTLERAAPVALPVWAHCKPRVEVAAPVTSTAAQLLQMLRVVVVLPAGQLLGCRALQVAHKVTTEEALAEQAQPGARVPAVAAQEDRGAVSRALAHSKVVQAVKDWLTQSAEPQAFMVLAVQEEVPLRVLVAQVSAAMVVPLLVDLRLRVIQTPGPAVVEEWVRGGPLELQGPSVAQV